MTIADLLQMTQCLIATNPDLLDSEIRYRFDSKYYATPSSIKVEREADGKTYLYFEEQ